MAVIDFDQNYQNEVNGTLVALIYLLEDLYAARFNATDHAGDALTAFTRQIETDMTHPITNSDKLLDLGEIAAIRHQAHLKLKFFATTLANRLR